MPVAAQPAQIPLSIEVENQPVACLSPAFPAKTASCLLPVHAATHSQLSSQTRRKYTHNPGRAYNPGKAALREMRRLIDMVPRDVYGDSLAGWLAGKSGKPKDDILKAVLAATPYTPARFESNLLRLGLIL